LNKNEELLIGQIKENEKKFMEAMDDDFNTPVALSWIFALNKEVNIYLTSEGFKNKKVLEDVVKFYHNLAGQVLGILGDEDLKINFEEQEIQNMIDEREKARKEKDWSMADKIRDKLKENGIILEDTSEGARWKKTIF
jgi:cysteinyl-tRNA synthetase